MNTSKLSISETRPVTDKSCLGVPVEVQRLFHTGIPNPIELPVE